MKNTTTPLLYMVCLLFVGFLMAAIPASDSGYQVGDTARDFKLKNVDGKMVSMSDYKNAKGFIVTFTCNTCPYSVAYEDRIIDLHNKYAPKGYPVIAINPNDVQVSPKDSYQDMQVRAREKKFPFAYVYDETQEITKAYGATRTPHLYVVQKQKDGKFKVAYIGTIDDNSREPEKVQKKYAEAALDELVSGKAVSQPNTKAIGCTIKWREA
ncbi:thioredoxin family protein [Pontibacter sp. JH31]|uniref:Thioredoxin family protein n=1 Tax=Pontibacter aquaedesilientis TaxID=2766980 RepID=A0ABR7XIN3_9BACT|nr:thioredoxin family protein [Pontibacter aquaedesilientis]MBD1398135.1 thioredoxin family protein [Pontibacter aquaedesilientis]